MKIKGGEKKRMWVWGYLEPRGNGSSNTHLFYTRLARLDASIARIGKVSINISSFSTEWEADASRCVTDGSWVSCGHTLPNNFGRTHIVPYKHASSVLHEHNQSVHSSLERWAERYTGWHCQKKIILIAEPNSTIILCQFDIYVGAPFSPYLWNMYHVTYGEAPFERGNWRMDASLNFDDQRFYLI